MDPFSIVVGVAGLLQVSAQLSQYVKVVLETASMFEGNINFLSREIEDLESVNISIKQLYEGDSVKYSYRQQEQLPQDLATWENTLKTLENCSETVQKLQNILNDILGKGGTGQLDSFKKRFRMQAKESELDKIRDKLSGHRASLNLSLTILNF